MRLGNLASASLKAATALMLILISACSAGPAPGTTVYRQAPVVIYQPPPVQPSETTSHNYNYNYNDSTSTIHSNVGLARLYSEQSPPADRR